MNSAVFIERLKEYMAEFNLNVTDLAEKIGYSRATVSAVLNGNRDPSTKMVLALVEAFSCSADYLLGLVEFPRTTQFKPAKPFGEVLRKCLKENKITERQLHREKGISNSLIYRWLYNIAMPKIDSLIKLTGYFNCSVDYLLGREN